MHVTQLLKNETEAETPARAGESWGAGGGEASRSLGVRPPGARGWERGGAGAGTGGGGAWVGSEVYPLSTPGRMGR